MLETKNSQQIGQIPINQPFQNPEKPKINYWMVSTLLLVALLVSSTVGFTFYQNSKSKFPPTEERAISGQTNQPTPPLLEPVTKSAPVVLFIKTNFPNYPKHKNGSIILNSFDTQSGSKNEVLNLDACYNLSSSLSPDKTKIAYISMTNSECEKQYYTNVGKADLWVYNFQDKTKQLVASDVWNHVTPQWSLSGKYLSYERVTDSQASREQKVYFYNLGSKEERLITTLTGASSGLIAISRGDSFIYFKTPFDLLKIDVKTGTQTKLFTVDNGYDANFYLSPDRSKMAVFSMEGWYGGKKTPTNWKIGVIDLTTDSYEEVYNGPDQLALLSSDSYGNRPIVTSTSQIIYGITGQNAGLWSINLTNGVKKLIKTIPQDIRGISTADLSPDEKHLLYGTWKTENTSPTENWSHWHYYVMNLSDSNVQEIENFDYRTEKAVYLINQD